MSPAAHAAARALLADPLTNKGTAFTEAERDQWGLHGLLPPHVGTLDSQIERRQRALAACRTTFIATASCANCRI